MKNKEIILLATGIGLLILLSNPSAASNSTHSTTWVLPLDSNITQPFGGEHNGIDLHAAIGTAIVAPANGTVEQVYYGDLGGNQLIIKHNNGFKTGYAHLSQSLVNIGDRVTQGQQIALTGNSGSATTGPHLHFVLTDANGIAINPVGIIYPSPTLS